MVTIPAEPGGESGSELVPQTAVDFVFGELADQVADRSAHDDRCEQRWRQESHDQPDATADLHALAAQVVAGLVDTDVAIGILRHQGHAFDLQLFLCDKLHELVELFSGQIRDQLRRNNDIELCVTHRSSFCSTRVVF
jgi:hypothetical protein